MKRWMRAKMVKLNTQRRAAYEAEATKSFYLCAPKAREGSGLRLPDPSPVKPAERSLVTRDLNRRDVAKPRGWLDAEYQRAHAMPASYQLIRNGRVVG